MVSAIEADLASLLGTDFVVTGDAVREYLHDSTEMQGLRGHADAVVAPRDAEAVQAVVRWCCERGVPIVPRGGGTGFAGGAVPEGGVVVSLEHLASVRAFEPESWRLQVDAGVTTSRVHRLARESGLFYPPDPGASEQSQIGGNLACNAGGPHSFKYGVTRDWVTGVEVVVADGELLHFGGACRKDVAGYDLVSLLVGSEGTLGIITGAHLKLIPAPEVTIPLVAAYRSAADGLAAVRRVYGFGLRSAVLEFLDAGAVGAAGAAFPGGLPAETAFLVLAEADGRAPEAEALALGLEESLAERAVHLAVLRSPAAQRELWRWRSGVSFAVAAQRGGKMSEDIAVPFDRLEEALALGEEAGRQAGLSTCSWGHAGDGNLHTTFLINASSPEEVARAAQAAEFLFAGTIALGGTVTGEHGLGLLKRAQLPRQLGIGEMRLQRAVKAAFDPRNLFNPGKKVTP
jgi:glycolate oxidase subunit GlcD